jgi:hypothetical protein
MDRLHDAGLEIKSHLAVVEDSLCQEVFGDDSDTTAPNGRPEAQKTKALPSKAQPQSKPLLTHGVLVYVLVAASVLAVSVGVGATAALISGGGLRLSEEQGKAQQEQNPQPSEEQGKAQQEQNPQPSEEQGKAQQEQNPQPSEEQGKAQPREADYVSKVGKLQGESVEAFLDSHNKLLHYDALTADDVEELQANQSTLQEFTDQASDLDAPQKYREQNEVFVSAIIELHEAAQLAYALAANPTSATQSRFEEYDRHVDKAAASLQRSTKILDRDDKTIEGVQRVSPP